jgi:hypothetical protein
MWPFSKKKTVNIEMDLEPSPMEELMRKVEFLIEEDLDGWTGPKQINKENKPAWEWRYRDSGVVLRNNGTIGSYDSKDTYIIPGHYSQEEKQRIKQMDVNLSALKLFRSLLKSEMQEV